MARKKKNYTVESIPPKRTIISVRKVILARLKQVNKTRNWLAVQTGLRTATVYTFLSGDADATGESIEKMLNVLGLVIVPK